MPAVRRGGLGSQRERGLVLVRRPRSRAPPSCSQAGARSRLARRRRRSAAAAGESRTLTASGLPMGLVMLALAVRSFLMRAIGLRLRPRWKRRRMRARHMVASSAWVISSSCSSSMPCHVNFLKARLALRALISSWVRSMVKGVRVCGGGEAKASAVSRRARRGRRRRSRTCAQARPGRGASVVLGRGGTTGYGRGAERWRRHLREPQRAGSGDGMARSEARCRGAKAQGARGSHGGSFTSL